MTIVKTSNFKGYKIFSIMRDKDDRYPFSFGVAKAKMIVEHMEEIQKFVEENKGEGEGE